MSLLPFTRFILYDIIAKAIPMTPIPSPTAKIQENTSRTPMVVNRETAVVYFTSPAARSPFPRGSAKGNAAVLKILWIGL